MVFVDRLNGLTENENAKHKGNITAGGEDENTHYLRSIRAHGGTMKYFISYHYRRESESGFSNMVITLDKEITNEEDIRNAQEIISEKVWGRAYGVRIAWFTLLEKVDYASRELNLTTTWS